MEWFVRAFLKASLAWLALGVSLGVAMAVHPPLTIHRVAHMHMTLLGFVTMMIYGVAYHVVPRFVGVPLHHRGAAGAHWWLSNVGLALMVTGFVVRTWRPDRGTPILGVGGGLSALGAYLFVWVIWRTVDGRRGQPESQRQAGSPLRDTARPPVPLHPKGTL
jgi:cbb3-type cytochrome oxidase subunit 1